MKGKSRIIFTLTDEVVYGLQMKKIWLTPHFLSGVIVIQHKDYCINDEVNMEARLQNLFFEKCITKNYLFELENEVL